MSNGDLSQEDYLAQTKLTGICMRGIKKLITEVSSMKTLAMAAFIGLNYMGKMDSLYTMIGVLGCVGAKEVDFTQITEIIKNKFGGK
jgi:hypothetical protein